MCYQRSNHARCLPLWLAFPKVVSFYGFVKNNITMVFKSILWLFNNIMAKKICTYYSSFIININDFTMKYLKQYHAVKLHVRSRLEYIHIYQFVSDTNTYTHDTHISRCPTNSKVWIIHGIQTPCCSGCWEDLCTRRSRNSWLMETIADQCC